MMLDRFEKRITKADIGNWSVLVEVPPVETRDEDAAGTRDIARRSASYRGKTFIADRLRITRDWSGDIIYRLTGANVRADGTPGKITLTRIVSRDYLDKVYPVTMIDAKAALTELAGEISRDAKTAVAAILSLAGE
jgi:hypothetical protein